MDRRKLALLFALQEQPTAPAAALAKRVQITPPTARAWLDSLRNEKVYEGVHASLHVRRLGLEMDDFFVQARDYESIKKIEQFCHEHPYTSYRARVYGGKNQGMLLQFRQPDDARRHLEDALEVFQNEGMIQGVRELPTLKEEYGSTFTRPRLDAWDSERLIWNFDWDEWWEKSDDDAPVDSKTVGQGGKLELDALDVKLLEQLTMDARRKNTEIIESIGLDKNVMGVQQKISTKIRRLDAEAVESYRVFINWTYFDVYNTPLIIAKAGTEETRQLISHLRNGQFPFGSSIRGTPDGFVWSARLPSNHLSEMIGLVWSLSDSYEFLTIDYKHSQTFGLWHKIFDEGTSEWRTDREFCYTRPLEKTGIL